jgi:4'-phosphopantetheinyl transferase EntD
MNATRLVNLFSDRLPQGLVVASTTDEGQEALLLEGEEEAVSAAPPSRQRSFALGRACAHRALANLGLDPCAVPVGSYGEPLWPQGIAGSITHRGGLWAAVVAHRSAYQALGIDVEINRPLPPRVRNRVISRSAPLPPSDSVHWDAVIFSAMESVFKARHFLHRPTRGLIEIKVLLDPQHLTFQGKIDTPDDNLPQIVDGVFAVEDDLILTAAIVPANLSAPTP